VITFEISFRPSAFDRPLTEYVKDEISFKLAAAGVSELIVIVERGPGGKLFFDFKGAAEEVAKAQAALRC
jgi:hypothetical protein